MAIYEFPFVQLPQPQQTRYRFIRVLGTEAVGQTFLVRDTQVADAGLRVVQQLNLSSQDTSLTQFGRSLLLHRAQTVQDIFDHLPQTGTLHSYFTDDRTFYIVQAVIRGVSWSRQQLSPTLAVRQQQLWTVLKDLLLLLQQVYDQGLTSCCLYPNDIVWQPAQQRCVWTGMGAFKSIVQQIQQTSQPQSTFFPGDSQGYFAPEFHRGQFHPGSDLYTLGMMTIQVLLQQPLSAWMQADGDRWTIRADWHLQAGLSEGWVDLLKGMVQSDLAQRYRMPLDVLRDLGDLNPNPSDSPDLIAELPSQRITLDVLNMSAMDGR